MRCVQQAVKRLAGDRLGLGLILHDAVDQARLLARKRRLGKYRRLQDLGKGRDRLRTLAFARPGGQGGTGVMAGNTGGCRSSAKVAIACARSRSLDRVRREKPARSRSTLPPSCAPTSAMRRLISSSECPADPALTSVWESPPSPALSAGTRRPPASKSTLMSSMGMLRLATK